MGGGLPELPLTFCFCPCPVEEKQEEEEEAMQPHGGWGEAEAVRVAGGGSIYGVLAAALHQWGWGRGFREGLGWRSGSTGWSGAEMPPFWVPPAASVPPVEGDSPVPPASPWEWSCLARGR